MDAIAQLGPPVMAGINTRQLPLQANSAGGGLRHADNDRQRELLLKRNQRHLALKASGTKAAAEKGGSVERQPRKGSNPRALPGTSAIVKDAAAPKSVAKRDAVREAARLGYGLQSQKPPAYIAPRLSKARHADRSRATMGNFRSSNSRNNVNLGSGHSDGPLDVLFN